MEKRNCSKAAISPLFHNIFNIHVSRISRVQLHIHLLNVIVRFIFSSILICRGMDISKYFRESLGIRDESRLYKENICWTITLPTHFENKLEIILWIYTWVPIIVVSDLNLVPANIITCTLRCGSSVTKYLLQLIWLVNTNELEVRRF